MPKIETYRWDAADYLNDEADRLAYLNAALEEGDPMLVAKALGDIARSRGMSQVAEQASRARASLHRSLSSGRDPEFGTVLSVLRALGLGLHAEPLQAAQPAGVMDSADGNPEARRRDV